MWSSSFLTLADEESTAVTSLPLRLSSMGTWMGWRREVEGSACIGPISPTTKTVLSK